tara:strand:- start:6256 stop:6921 length:666 start_codon:yes stop_codon:yes gene_type:complete
MNSVEDDKKEIERLKNMDMVFNFRPNILGSYKKVIPLFLLMSLFFYTYMSLPMVSEISSAQLLGVDYVKFPININLLANITLGLFILNLLFIIYIITLELTTIVSVDKLRLTYTRGIFVREDHSMDFTGVEDLSTRRNPIDWILSLKDLKIEAKDNTHPILLLAGYSKEDTDFLFVFVRMFALNRYTEYRIFKDILRKNHGGKYKQIYGDQIEGIESDGDL